jgi:hypothetical protein
MLLITKSSGRKGKNNAVAIPPYQNGKAEGRLRSQQGNETQRNISEASSNQETRSGRRENEN